MTLFTDGADVGAFDAFLTEDVDLGAVDAQDGLLDSLSDTLGTASLGEAILSAGVETKSWIEFARRRFAPAQHRRIVVHPSALSGTGPATSPQDLSSN